MRRACRRGKFPDSGKKDFFPGRIPRAAEQLLLDDLAENHYNEMKQDKDV